MLEIVALKRGSGVSAAVIEESKTTTFLLFLRAEEGGEEEGRTRGAGGGNVGNVITRVESGEVDTATLTTVTFVLFLSR